MDDPPTALAMIYATCLSDIIQAGIEEWRMIAEQPNKPKPIRARCPLGSFAPCPDDLCHGSDTTLCGLEHGEDFCEHGYIPETCGECRDERDFDE